MYPVKAPKKLIEVALPLDDINIASAREKSIRHGHPSTLHLWWARRPLAAARAVLFAQLVNDPGYESGAGFQRGVNKKDAALERERLFDIIRKLVLWENTNNEAVLAEARVEIWKSWRETCKLNERHPQAAELFNPEKLPAFHDPFAGGGAIPMEAQRLGLEAHASDLNPVAVLINKVMVEIPPKFAGRAPIGPLPQSSEPTERSTKEMHEDWPGASGLAEDVRRYGHWVREEAQRRIGHLYPKVEITAKMATNRPDLRPYVGQKPLTVIAWLWVRTVRSPNPAYSNVEVPLASSFLLSAKVGREVWVEPVVSGNDYYFEIRTAATHQRPPLSAKSGTKVSQGAFRCLMSDTPIKYDYADTEANSGRMGIRLMALVAEGTRGRVYLNPTEAMETVAMSAKPIWRPETPCRGTFASNAQGRRYGFNDFGDYFTPRQLVALTTLADVVAESRERIRADALKCGMHDDGLGLDVSGEGATAYGEAVANGLAFAISRSADRGSSICSWDSSPKMEALRNTYGRQGIPMVWDFAEGNPFSDSSGNWINNIDWVSKALAKVPAISSGIAVQSDAATQKISTAKIVSTDPPYYDNIGYADLSDFFYVWLRRTLRTIYPTLFSTLAVPKAEELVAIPHRHGGKENAEKFFLDGMTSAMRNVGELAHSAFPVTIYYAFKQSETKDAGTSSTGWEIFLAAVIRAGFVLTGTWPVRTELGNRMVSSGANALASSIILVCRCRQTDAPTVSRKEFLRELKAQLSEALDAMIGGGDGASPITPVDLAQSAIGPGMAVYSKYSAVLEANGEPMTVHTALTLINKQVDEVLGGENFDADTNFCLGWFQDVGWSAGEFGSANTLAQAKATTVVAVEQAGVISAKGGKVKLHKPADYPSDWDPRTDQRTPVWEALHQLVRALSQGGESAAGALLARMPERGGDIRRLAFWLYTLCERKGWAEDARHYNELVTAWHAIETASHDSGHQGAQLQMDL